MKEIYTAISGQGGSTYYMVHFRFNFRNTALFVFLFFIVLKFSNLANHKDSEEKVSDRKSYTF